MNKRLVITYGDNVLYDGEPEQFSWRESDTSIEVKAGQAQANPLNQLAGMLQQPRRQLQQ